MAKSPKRLREDDPSFSKLNEIMENVLDLEKQVGAFQGEKNSKEYKFLDEELTRKLIALDKIETAGQDNVKQLRKESIKSINNCISILESKAKTYEAETSSKKSPRKMETSPIKVRIIMQMGDEKFCGLFINSQLDIHSHFSTKLPINLRKKYGNSGYIDPRGKIRIFLRSLSNF